MSSYPDLPPTDPTPEDQRSAAFRYLSFGGPEDPSVAQGFSYSREAANVWDEDTFDDDEGPDAGDTLVEQAATHTTQSDPSESPEDRVRRIKQEKADRAKVFNERLLATNQQSLRSIVEFDRAIEASTGTARILMHRDLPTASRFWTSAHNRDELKEAVRLIPEVTDAIEKRDKDQYILIELDDREANPSQNDRDPRPRRKATLAHSSKFTDSNFVPFDVTFGRFYKSLRSSMAESQQ